MPLLETMNEEMKKAMKEGRSDDLSIYRLLIAAYKNKKIELKRELNDEEFIQILQKQAKQRKDSIEQYEQGGRKDLADKEKYELSVIEKMLPAQMSEADVEAIVRTVMEETGFKSAADRGKLMGAAMAKLKGQTDGATVNKIVTKLLS